MSADLKHTPGPWAHDGLCIFAGEPRRWIASVACDKSDNIAERRANIALMANADELLRVLTEDGGVMWMADEWLKTNGSKLMNLPDFQQRYDQARAAIAKAGA